MSKQEFAIMRYYEVTKHNDLIQRSRYELSMQEQKIILYLITKIKPTDKELKPYEFKIKDFCQVCGIDIDSGKNYSNLKTVIKNLADKSMWVKLDDGRKTLVRWIERPYVSEETGRLQIKLDALMRPYLLELKKNFTSYKLYYILAMKSKYSIRMYEILKSYEFIGEIGFQIDELKEILNAQNYDTYKNFRVKVIDTAIKEINDFGDISINYITRKKGKKVDRIIFTIIKKTDENYDKTRTWRRIEKNLNKI